MAVCALVHGGKNGGYGVDYAVEAKRLLDEADDAGLRLRWLTVDGDGDGAERSGHVYSPFEPQQCLCVYAPCWW